MRAEDDGLDGDGFVGHDLGPVGRERFPIPGREGGHPVRLLVQLVFEEYGKVILSHIPQEDLGRHGVILTDALTDIGPTGYARTGGSPGSKPPI